MSWHCSQGQEEGFSLPNYLDGLRSARSRSSPLGDECCFSGNETGCSTSSRSGTTSEPSTDDPGEVLLMSSAGDFRVKTSAQRVPAKDLPEIVRDFGLSLNESLARYGLRLSSRKTVRTFVPVDLAPSSMDLPAWGMTHGGGCWELGTSVPYTDDPECGWLPTPTKNEMRTRCRSTLIARRERCKAKHKNGNGFGLTLGNYLTMQGCDGEMSPMWIEQLMGWPIGWTGSEPLETGKFQSWLQSHSGYSAKG